MPHHDDVRVIGDDADRVGDGFALGCGARSRIGAGDAFAAEPRHCALERKPRARARLVEQSGENTVGREIRAAGNSMGRRRIAEVLEIVLRFFEDQLDFFIGEIVDGNHMAECGGLGAMAHIGQPRWLPLMSRPGRMKRLRRCPLKPLL